MTEAQVPLNIHELGIILTALSLIDGRDDILIAKEYGSVSALKDRLQFLYQQLDSSSLSLSNDFEPSY